MVILLNNHYFIVKHYLKQENITETERIKKDKTLINKYA